MLFNDAKFEELVKNEENLNRICKIYDSYFDRLSQENQENLRYKVYRVIFSLKTFLDENPLNSPENI